MPLRSQNKREREKRGEKKRERERHQCYLPLLFFDSRKLLIQMFKILRNIQKKRKRKRIYKMYIYKKYFFSKIFELFFERNCFVSSKSYRTYIKCV